MFMKFTSKAETDDEVLKKLMTAETDPTVPKEIKEKVGIGRPKTRRWAEASAATWAHL